jgi:hypothetical protein
MAEKEQRLIQELSDELGISLTFTPLVYKRLEELIRRGLDGMDVTSILELDEERIGVSVSIPAEALS